MKKFALMGYAIAAYGIGLSSLVYMIGFLTNHYVPKGIDTGETQGLYFSVFINLLLSIGYFSLHSIMARPRFKEWWTRIIPPSIERSTYVMLSAITLYLLVLFWQPINLTIWSIENDYAQAGIYSIYLAAWAAMMFATFNIDHFSFFGLRQVWADLLTRSSETLTFSTKYLYRLTRHPISFCWFVVLWMTPLMTLGHMLLAIVGTLYIIIVTPIEEKDLINEIGEPYEQYKKDVRRFIPIPKQTKA